MKIGLDYDKTYSADPTFWKGFINLATAMGHDVRIVTVRDDRALTEQPRSSRSS